MVMLSLHFNSLRPWSLQPSGLGLPLDGLHVGNLVDGTEARRRRRGVLRGLGRRARVRHELLQAGVDVRILLLGHQFHLEGRRWGRRRFGFLSLHFRGGWWRGLRGFRDCSQVLGNWEGRCRGGGKDRNYQGWFVLGRRRRDHSLAGLGFAGHRAGH